MLVLVYCHIIMSDGPGCLRRGHSRRSNYRLDSCEVSCVVRAFPPSHFPAVHVSEQCVTEKNVSLCERLRPRAPCGSVRRWSRTMDLFLMCRITPRLWYCNSAGNGPKVRSMHATWNCPGLGSRKLSREVSTLILISPPYHQTAFNCKNISQQNVNDRTLKATA